MIEQVHLDTYYVLFLEPDFASTPKMQAAREIDVIDVSTAPLYAQIRGADVKHTLSFDFELQGIDEIRYIGEFFFHHKGKWQPFFVPSWHKELRLAATGEADSDRVTIEAVNYGATYFQNTGHRLELGHYIFMLHEDGTLFLSRVLEIVGWPPPSDSAGSGSGSASTESTDVSGSTQSEAEATTEVLVLEETLPRNFEVEKTVMGFLYFVRFMHDDLELEHKGPDLANTKLTFQEVLIGDWLPSNINEFDFEVDVTYSGCLDVVEFSWPYVEGDTIQTAAAQGGPWYDYIEVVPDVYQANGNVLIQINNSFNGERFFRLAGADGERKSKVYQPTAPNVAMPTALAVDNTDESPYGLHMTPLGTGQEAGDSEPFTRPLSYIENALMNPTRVYVEPVGRVEYSRGSNWDGTTNAVSAETGGKTFRWTRDGSDPTDEMDWTPPAYEGVAFNARVYSPDFAFAVRARCFSGECRSPLALLLVDRRDDVVHMTRTLANFSQYSGYCDLPRVDEFGRVSESGFSCELNFGGTSGPAPSFQAHVREQVCASFTSGGIMTIGGKLAIYRRISSETSGFPTWMGWQGYSAYELRWLMNIFEPNGFRSASFWDVVPKVYEYAVATVGGLEIKNLGAGPASGLHLSGSSGSLVDHCSVTQPELVAFVPGCPNPANDSLVLDSFELVLTLNDDDAFTVPEVPPDMPEQPDPPEPLEGFYELWEEYTDTETAEVEFLNAGTGWDAAWFLTNEELTEGYDLWDEVADELFDVDDEVFIAPNGGQGWDEAWVFHDDGDNRDFKALWEEFSDVVLLPGSLPISGGTGWAWFDEDFDIQEPWTFNDNGFQNGKDLMESYSDGAVTGATALNENSDSSWEASGPWVFLLLAPSALSAIAVSDTEIDLSWTDNGDSEDGFRIERKTGVGGTYAEIDTVSTDVVTYSDTGLVAETEYYYRVRAFAGTDNTHYSNEADATTLPETPAPGLVLWLEADAIVGLSDTDPITTWPAHIGSDPTASATERPLYRTNQINGLPAVEFDGSNDRFTVPDFFAGTETAAEMFIIVRIDNDPPGSVNQVGMWHLAGGGVVNAFPSTDSNVYDGFGSTARKTVGNPTPSLTSWRLYNVSSAAGDWTVRLDGTQIFTTASNTFQGSVSGTMGITRKLGQSGGLSHFLDGMVAGLFVFDHVLSAGDRTLVHDYISAKYGLTIA